MTNPELLGCIFKLRSFVGRNNPNLVVNLKEMEEAFVNLLSVLCAGVGP